MVLCVMIVGIHLLPLSFVNSWDLKEQMVKHTLFHMLKYIHRSSVDGLYAIQHEYIPCLYCIIESTSIPVRLMLDDY